MSEAETAHSAGGRLDRLFRGRIDGNRKKAFTLPFGLLNRRKRTSPNEVEDANGNRRRAATDYSKQQRIQQQQQRAQQQQQDGTPFDGSRQPSTPSTPAATVTPKPLRLLLPASSKEGIRGILANPIQPGPPLSAPPAGRRHAVRDEGHERSADHQQQQTSMDASRPRRPSFTLAARGGTLMVSGDAPPAPHSTAASSPDPIAHHDTPSPGSTSRSSAPSVRTRATTIQGATPILPSQRGIHGSTSAEALAAATGDQPYTLQRVRRTFSDAFRQTRARQVALERISHGAPAATLEEEGEGEQDLQGDAEATLVHNRQHPPAPPAKSLPWTNAMLSAHHHLTPVGEDPNRESVFGRQFPREQESEQEQEVLSPQRQEYQRPPLSASKQDSTSYSADATAVDTTHVPAAEFHGPEPPSRKSSLSKLKAELVQSFLANSRAGDGQGGRKRDEVDTPFTPVYMTREKSLTKGEDSTAPPQPPSKGDDLSPPPAQHSPTASTHAHSYAHSSYHSHFSPTSTQQALYASKQRLIGPLEAQLAALDSQFNSIFHMLEVRRLEQQYTELQRRIEEKRRIVAQLEMALGDGVSGGGDNASLSVAPSEAQHASQRGLEDDDDGDGDDNESNERHGRDRSTSTRPSLSYDSQRVDVRQSDPSETATPTPTGTIPIQPPQATTPATFKTLSGSDMRDSLPVSTTDGLNSRVASCATFGQPEHDSSTSNKLALALPKGMMARSLSNRSDSTTRSVVGASDVASRPFAVQRLSNATSASGWESSPTLPKKAAGVALPV